MALFRTMDALRRRQIARLQELEHRTGLKVSAIAEKAGIAHTTLTRLYKADHQNALSSKTLAKIEDAFPEFKDMVGLDHDIFGNLLRPLFRSYGYAEEDVEGILRSVLSAYEAALSPDGGADPLMKSAAVGQYLVTRYPLPRKS